MGLLYSPGADSENLDFATPLEEHRFYGIICFFCSPAFYLKAFPLKKKYPEDHFLQSSAAHKTVTNIANLINFFVPRHFSGVVMF